MNLVTEMSTTMACVMNDLTFIVDFQLITFSKRIQFENSFRISDFPRYDSCISCQYNTLQTLKHNLLLSKRNNNFLTEQNSINDVASDEPPNATSLPPITSIVIPTAQEAWIEPRCTKTVDVGNSSVQKMMLPHTNCGDGHVIEMNDGQLDIVPLDRNFSDLRQIVAAL